MVSDLYILKIRFFSLFLTAQLYLSWLHYYHHEGEERYSSFVFIILLHLIIALSSFITFLFSWKCIKKNLGLLIIGFLAIYAGSDTDSNRFKISCLLMDIILFIQVSYWYLVAKTLSRPDVH